ncbi:MAG: sodium-dependent transporter [Candidatus Neomarinimicrobiota bacterium]|nr:MAG: sodium-dependent transporter [Candidatus Neomarinimicrobiota bacterium]
MKKRESWGTHVGFILAAAGSAIGLGNIWKFPYIAGENGGAAFVFVYLICIALIGLPVLMAEILMGRETQRNPVGAFRALNNSKFWIAVGGMGVVAGFLILSYYNVVAGWALGYIVEAIKGSFFDYTTPAMAGEHFNQLVQTPVWILGYHLLFAGLTMFVVYAGVKKGIELGSKIMMPLLFVIIVILVIRGITLPGSGKGMAFLWVADWSKINGNSVLVALGHAFFTLSLGMGAMMTYGSYMSREDDIPSSALQIVILDTLIALLAGIAIFTAVFSAGLNPAVGPGLIFQTLPVVFAKMPGGYLFSILFFILLVLAALSSAISLLEVIVAYFVDEKGWDRHRAVLVMGTIVFLIGVPSSLSYNLMADVKVFGLNFFDLVDYLAANILLPLGGFLIAVFVAWIWGSDRALRAIKSGAATWFRQRHEVSAGWLSVLKYFAPVMIFVVFLYSIGIIRF